MFFVSSLRPLWLDEMLQLAIAAHPIDHSYFDQIRFNAGAAPLGYLAGTASERAFGITWIGSRLPSLLASFAAVISLFLLLAEVDFSHPEFACAFFAVCPLQLRYATEGRPYELALLFSILSSLLAIRLERAPSLKNTAIYTLLLAIGIYFQPFVAFVAIGHAIWIGLQAIRMRSSKALTRTAAGLAIALAVFLPWYLFASPEWHPERIPFTPGLVLVIIREISGDGYWCSIPLVIAALVGLRRTPLAVTIPTLTALLGPFVADAAFGYFFAIRQFLFALPGLVIAASVGLVEIQKRSRFAATILVLTFCAGAMSKTISYFGDHSENWASAAAYLNSKSVAGDRVVFLPKDTVNLYALFAPSLKDRTCRPESAVARRIFSLTPHAPDSVRQVFQRESAGLPVVSIGGSLIATR